MQYNNRSASAMGAVTKWVVVIAAVGAIGAVGYFFIGDQIGKPPKLHDLPNPVPLQQAATPESHSLAKPVYDEPVPDPIP